MFVETPQNGFQKNYKEKAERKIKYYDTLEEYEFIALYYDDMHNNFEGVINKLNKYGLNITFKIAV